MKKTINIKNVKFKAPKSKSYNKKDLSKGKSIEGEHTSNKKVQSVIAKNHLDEDKSYYDKLQKMEQKKTKKRAPRGTYNRRSK